MRRLRVVVVAALACVGVLAASAAPVGAALFARPAAVTGLSVQAGDAPGELRVSWDAHPQGAVDYRVAWTRVGSNFKKISATSWNAFPEDNELTISGLSPGESYKVKVRARFSGPNGRWSPAVKGTAAAETTTPTKEADKESTPVIARHHAPERNLEFDMSDSINCGLSECARTKTYSMSLTGGQRYVAEVWGRSTVGGGDATHLGIVAVRAPDGTKLGSDLSGLAITLREPRVVFTASSLSGTHSVVVQINGRGDFEPSTFRVVVYPYVPYEECKANVRTGCTVMVGTPQSGELEVDSLSRSDVDWFAVELSGGRIYEIVLRPDGDSHRPLRDPFLNGVYDHRGRLLHTDGSVYPFPYFGATGGTADRNSGPGVTALTYFIPITTGTYYIGATSAGGRNRAGHYILGVRTYGIGVLANDDCYPGMDAMGHNAYSEVIFRYHYGQRLGIPNTQAEYEAASFRLPGTFTQCTIQVGQTVIGRIEHNGLLSSRFSGSTLVPGDRDWFGVNLTGGVRYRIEVETRASGMHHPDLGGVYDSGGVRVRNGNGSSGDSAYSERIHFEPATTGVYYLEVAGPASSGPYNTGRYWLTLTEDS